MCSVAIHASLLLLSALARCVGQACHLSRNCPCRQLPFTVGKLSVRKVLRKSRAFWRKPDEVTSEAHVNSQEKAGRRQRI